VAVVVGLILGWFVSKILDRLLRISDIQKTLVRYGAVTTHLWDQVVTFLSHYMLWLTLIFVINVTFYRNHLLEGLFLFMTNLLALVVFTLIGIMIGGIIYKIGKQTLVAVVLEAELEKHRISDKLGGISLTTVLASVLQWYIVLVFLTTGVQQFLSTIHVSGTELALSEAMKNLMNYVPQAILGVLVIIATLIIADIVSVNLKKKTHAFSDAIAIGAEAVVLFFGVIIALPKLLGVPDPEGVIFMQSLSVMTDSFKFLVIGISLGIAIAVGLGMKDYVARVAKKL